MFCFRKCSLFVKDTKSIRDTIMKRSASLASDSTKPPGNKVDVVIVGAGCMGTLTAFWLKKQAGAALNIVVIDRDLTYKTASTVLSAGGVRQQFTLKENIQLSCFGADFVQNTEKYVGKFVDVQFKSRGYLILASEKGIELLQENHKTQVKCGAANTLLTPPDIKEKFPWLNTADIKLGCYGQKNEGWMDPWLYLIAMRDAAKELGVHFLEAVPCEFNSRKVQSLVKVGNETISDEKRILSDIVMKTSTGEIKRLEFKTCILATGADTGKLAKELLGIDRCNSGALQYEIPIDRRKRYIYFLECRNNDIESSCCPMIIDTKGVYVRREGAENHYICGNSPSEEEEPPTDDLEVDYEYFDDAIWPALAHRIPCFEAVKVKSGWAGFYDYNFFDQNGIIGFHPAYENMIIVAGFSGHGLQHSPAVGRAVSELLLKGCFQTIDLSRFSFERVIKNQPLLEHVII